MNYLIRRADLGRVRQELSRMMAEASVMPKVRDFTLSITPPYGNDQIRAVYEYTKQNIRYERDPHAVELFIAPWRMIDMIERGNAAGDCDDLALFNASLLRSIGYDTKILLVDVEGLGYDHAVAEVYSERLGEWITVDSASDKPLGWMGKYHKKMEVS